MKRVLLILAALLAAGFLLGSRSEADEMAATAKTGPGERHVVAEVFAVEDEEHGGHPM